MGVYIKGMEMSDRCSRCDAAFPDGVGWSCPLIKGRPNIDNQKGRRKDCPLGPVSPHGEWYGEADGYADGELVYDTWSCGCCGKHFPEWDEKPDWNYCPNCGANMREAHDGI